MKSRMSVVVVVVVVAALMWLMPPGVECGVLPWLFTVRAAKRHTEPRYDPYLDLRLCNMDQVCRRGEFCDQHYGVCRIKVSINQHCRRDAMCDRGMDCMFGKCQPRVQRGEEGARCRKDRDCGKDMCCVRRSGEEVCQRRLPLGAACFVPEGGPEYAVNGKCPCLDFLICKYVSSDPPPQDPTSAFWNTYDNMRCVPPSHTPPPPERHST